MKSVIQILLVEDDSADEISLMRQLKKADLAPHIKIIHDGGQALDYLTDERYHCEEFAAVFLDLKLPTVDGLQLLETIRTNDRTSRLPVIVMTSESSPKNCRSARRSAFPITCKSP